MTVRKSSGTETRTGNPRAFAWIVLAAMAAAAIASVSSLASRLQAADPAVVGQWSAPFQIGAVGIHSIVLPTGKVLLFYYPSSGIGSAARIWDPASGTITDATLDRARDIFCAGHSLLADGRLFISGGHQYEGPSEVGTVENDTFDPLSETFTQAAPLLAARWYPTTLELGNGRVLVFDGQPDTIEEYDPSTNTVTERPPSATFDLGLYPRMNLLPSGKIVFSNLSVTRLFDPATNAWSVVGSTRYGTRGESGISMLLPGGNKLMRFGGRGIGGSTATAEIIDFSEPTPTWRYTGSMNRKRQWLNGVLLPDGKVLAVGGGGFGNFGGPVREAEVYDPATETWTLMASQVAPRMYHSTAVLLPDGRVLSAGQNSSSSYQTFGEIYSPPYLFKGPRPTIAAAPASVAYGEDFTVSTPDAAAIDRVALIRPDSVTHSVNFDQRYALLAHSAWDGGTLTVTAPANANHAPPGWYMLFILSNGVPSVASWVQVAATPPPPDTTAPVVSLTAPADGSSSSDMTPTFSGTAGTAEGDSATVTVKVYAGADTGGALLQTLAATRAGTSAYSVDASPALAIGTYTAQAEQTDAAGNTGLSTANTFTITEPPPDTTAPVVSLTAPPDGSSSPDTTPTFSGTAGTAEGDSATVTVTVYAGADTGGALLQTLAAAATGAYSVDASPALAPGTYTAQAEQTDAAGNTGLSTATTFTITEPPPAGSYSFEVLSDGPRGYWRLGEVSGTAAADEIGVAPGTYRDGVTLGVPGALAGDANAAARFDGANDRVDMGDPASLDFGTGDFTVELWMRTLLNKEEAAVSKQGSGPYWQVTVTDDSGHVGHIRAKLFDGVVTRQVYGPAVRVDDGLWHHVVVVFERDSGTTVYVDGIQLATAGAMAGDVSNVAPLLVGKATGYPYFNGDLDEVALYPAALSPLRVQAHYAAGRGSP